MAWLGEWLRDIVLIVLFAAFVDLLVPDNALKKYVKLTISLMILITILAPLVEWLKPGLDIREEAFGAMPAGDAGIPPLASVLEAGGRLRMEAESRAARLAEEQIAGQIRRQVGRAFPVSVVSADVRLVPGDEEGMAEIGAVRLVLAPLSESGDSAEPDAAQSGPRGSGTGGNERQGTARPAAGWPDAGLKDAGGEVVGRLGAVSPVKVEAVEVTVPGLAGSDRSTSGATRNMSRRAYPDTLRNASRTEADGMAAAETDASRRASVEQTEPADRRRLAADVAVQVGLWWGIGGERIEVIWADA